MRVTLVGLVAGGPAGVPRYAACLARAVDQVSGEFPELSLSLLTTRTGARAVGATSIEVRTLGIDSRRLNRGIGRIAAEQVAVRSDAADVLHFFDLTGPVLSPRRPFVATVHDVAVLRGFGGVSQVYKRRLMPWATRRARGIVAISQFAKDELVRVFDVEPRKVTVIRSGPGLAESAPSARSEQTAPRSPYLLFVGNLTDRKNVPFLVHAFDRADVPADLLVVGRRLDAYRDVARAIESARRPERIHLLHDVPDSDLDRLYREARALVLPSRYEGFGLTALEAMQRGCPVLASDIPAVREISGSGPHLLPVDDGVAWSDAIRRVVLDDEFRMSLRARAPEAVRSYSWQQAARELCSLHRHLARSQPGPSPSPGT